MVAEIMVNKSDLKEKGGKKEMRLTEMEDRYKLRQIERAILNNVSIKLILIMIISN